MPVVQIVEARQVNASVYLSSYSGLALESISRANQSTLQRPRWVCRPAD